MRRISALAVACGALVVLAGFHAVRVWRALPGHAAAWARDPFGQGLDLTLSIVLLAACLVGLGVILWNEAGLGAAARKRFGRRGR